MTNSKLTKATHVLTHISQIIYRIGSTCMAVGLVLFLLDRGLLHDTLVKGSPDPGAVLSLHGFEIVYGNPDGTINNAAMIIFLICGGLILELMSWVFRHVHKIFHNIQDKSPFQPENVRLMREIGIFFLAIVAVKMLASFAAVIAIGIDAAVDTSLMPDIITGLLMLCLSQIFAQGVQMQEDVDGLV